MKINKAIQIAKRYKKKIERAGFPVQGMYIFGSTAKETAYDGSDIDICVVSPKFGGDMHAERVKLMNMSSTINESIEPHPFTIKDMKERYNPLVNEILKYGVQVI